MVIEVTSRWINPDQLKIAVQDSIVAAIGTMI